MRQHRLVPTFVVLVLLALACAPADRSAAPAGGAAPAPGGSAPAPAASGPSSAAPAAQAPVQSQPRLSVRVGYTAMVPSQSVAWIAYEAGIFDRHGLDISLHYINGGPAGLAALLSGELDTLVVGASSIVRSGIQGTDAVMIAGTKPQLLGAIIGRPDIRSPQELRGKRIGVATRASNSELVARVGLMANGVDPDADITYLAVGSGGPRLTAMQQGTVDACGCIPPDNIVLEAAGFRTIVDVSALNYKYLATGVAAMRSKTQAQPDLYRRFLEAFAEGVHKYKTDPDFAQKVISDYTQVDDMQSLREGYELERSIMASDLRIEREGLQSVIEETALSIPQAATANPDDFVERRFLNDLQAAGVFERLGR
jgi:NitT/TauT family transport system substrate-binding protein